MRLKQLDMTQVGHAIRHLPRGTLRVAFSGGMDSTVLLHAVAERLREQGELDRLTAHHLNHGLLAESADWAAHCRSFAAALGVSFECDRLSILSNGNMEQRAREARYARWAEVLCEDETLLLAHHARDQAETLLMRLMRGAGGELLRGMPREREFAKGRIWRPFLRVPHEAIEDYARAHELEWCEDPSNQELDKDRNYVRLKLLPLLVRRWPEAVAALASSSETLDREQGRVDALLAESVETVLEGGQGLSVDALLSLPGEAQILVLRRALLRMGVHSLSEARLDEILRQVSLPTDRTLDFSLSGGQSLGRYAGRLVLRRTPPINAQDRHTWNLEEDLRLPHGQLSALAEVREEAACLSNEVRRVEVRFRAGGERMRVRGMTRKVSRLLQEASIAPWLRGGWPMLYLDDTLVALPGVALEDAFVRDRGWKVQWSPD